MIEPRTVLIRPTESEVRRRGLVLLAAGMEHRHVGRTSDHLLHQARLPIPALPAISITHPLPSLAGALDHVEHRLELDLTADEHCLGGAPSLVPVTSPTMDARTGSDFPFAANASIGVASKVVRERSNTISVERICPAPPCS